MCLFIKFLGVALKKTITVPLLSFSKGIPFNFKLKFISFSIIISSSFSEFKFIQSDVFIL